MDGFTSFPVTSAYVLYEVQVNNEHVSIVKTLAAANKIKKSLKENNNSDKLFIIRAYKRIGFADNGQIFCSNGRSYAIEDINKNEQNAIINL